MGSVGSKIYSQGRRLIIRYNAENRAYKFLDKGNLPTAPRHKVEKAKEISLSREALEDIHCKSVQLNEYLKKVYLTSTSTITGTPSKRPKPKKENEKLKKFLFYEPEIPAAGCCTLSNIVEILLKFEPDSDNWNVNAIAEKFKLNKKDVVLLISYYSLYRHETFDFMNEEEKEPEKEPEKITFEVFNQLEKKSARQIDSK